MLKRRHIKGLQIKDYPYEQASREEYYKEQEQHRLRVAPEISKYTPCIADRHKGVSRCRIVVRHTYSHHALAVLF